MTEVREFVIELSRTEEPLDVGEIKDFPVNAKFEGIFKLKNNIHRKGIVHYLNGYPNIDISSSNEENPLYLSRFFDKINVNQRDAQSPRVPNMELCPEGSESVVPDSEEAITLEPEIEHSENQNEEEIENIEKNENIENVENTEVDTKQTVVKKNSW
jgi:hypothetical protein